MSKHVNWSGGYAEIRQKLGHSFCKAMIYKVILEFMAC